MTSTYEQPNNANTVQPAVDSIPSVPQDQDQKQAEVKPSVKGELDLFLKKAKNFGEKMIDKAQDRLSMEGQLKQASISLKQFLSPELEIEQQIPTALLSGAKGIVFLTVIKGGFGIGGSIGTGVVICRLDYGEGWSAPCSIGALGGQWGFNIGVQKTDFIIILRTKQAVQTFTSKGQIKFGADISVAVGPMGRDANVAVSISENAFAPIVSYSNAKGAYIGIALEGQGIMVRNDCNERFYGEKVGVVKILDGTVQMKGNEDYDQIGALLSAYTNDIVDQEFNNNNNAGGSGNVVT